MADATLIHSEKLVRSDGSIVQIRIWSLPTERRVPGSAHGYKYSLFYGRPGERIVGYDNEAGKGDHVHRRGVEEPYLFESVEKLISDFIADVNSS